ncbi:hypothetical protein BDR22DRAFT_827301 [Usnea florida]
MARYWNNTRAPPPSGLVEYIYSDTASGSVMRRLVVEWHGLRGDAWFGSKEVLERVPAFAWELAMALGIWYSRGGERLLIERGEEWGGGETEEEKEDEDETEEEGGNAKVKTEIRETSESDGTGVASKGSTNRARRPPSFLLAQQKSSQSQRGGQGDRANKNEGRRFDIGSLPDEIENW